MKFVAMFYGLLVRVRCAVAAAAAAAEAEARDIHYNSGCLWTECYLCKFVSLPPSLPLSACGLRDLVDSVLLPLLLPLLLLLFSLV